jgi:cysteine synthase
VTPIRSRCWCGTAWRANDPQPKRRRTRTWRAKAIRQIEADFNRSADTHLIRLDLPQYPGITLYLKDESSHPTGSLKHRLARSLFLYALCNGWIGPDTCVIEASSGSTAVSEAYFAHLLGLRFIAVVPASTAAPKLEAIRFHGGEIHAVDDPRTVYDVAHRLAGETKGHYLDQFTYAERATDWRGNNNIAESIFSQMAAEAFPVPAWIVCGAGTGGTSATIGRYIAYQRHATRLCVADPVHSVFHRHFADATVTASARKAATARGSKGSAAPASSPASSPSVIDRMIAVDDADSIGAMRALSRSAGAAGRRVDRHQPDRPSHDADRRHGKRRAAPAASSRLLCDGGERYGCTYYDDALAAGARDRLAAP